MTNGGMLNGCLVVAGCLDRVAGSRSRWEIAANYEERSVFARFARRHSRLPAWCCYAWKCSSSWQPVTRLASFPAYYRLSSLFYVIPRVSIALRLVNRFDIPSRESIFQPFSVKICYMAEKEIIIFSSFFHKRFNTILYFTVKNKSCWQFSFPNCFRIIEIFFQCTQFNYI